jgi:hypothetical protein
LVSICPRRITKQGSTLLRFLLVEAAQAAARCDADCRRRYVHLAMRRQRNIAQVAMARRLGSAVVLDVAKRLGICTASEVRFERGTARYRTWRAVERRPHEWASRSLARGSLNYRSWVRRDKPVITVGCVQRIALTTVNPSLRSRWPQAPLQSRAFLDLPERLRRRNRRHLPTEFDSSSSGTPIFDS